jgi:hypothetical protein
MGRRLVVCLLAWFGAVACSSSSPPRPSLRVFVTSETMTGDFGGLAGADDHCTRLAQAASLPGTFKAWLSDSTTNAADRLSHGTKPYALVDETAVAASWAELVSGTLRHGIDKTEKGDPAPVGANYCLAGGRAAAWTDTESDGTRSAGDFSCGDWTSAGSDHGAQMGFASSTDISWTRACNPDPRTNVACGWKASLYCIEQ